MADQGQPYQESPQSSTPPSSTQLPWEEKLEARRSFVRIIVTYASTAFLFLGGTLFIAFLIWTGQRDEALALFNTILPVSASIVAYWFAGRRSNSK